VHAPGHDPPQSMYVSTCLRVYVSMAALMGHQPVKHDHVAAASAREPENRVSSRFYSIQTLHTFRSTSGRAGAIDVTVTVRGRVAPDPRTPPPARGRVGAVAGRVILIEFRVHCCNLI
jgi:hypothetical protein